MNSLSLTPPSSALLKRRHSLHHIHIHINQKRRMRSGRCKASLLHEAPFAAAIGACVVNSLVSPLPVGPNDKEDGESVIESADARFAVMGIISFIPYFNWMSWVFAWMDTEDKRYAAYAVVYLAPYFRSNFSLLPEESWLPIASILACILHIQLEASIKNRDIQIFPLLDQKDKQETRKDEKNQALSSDESRNKIPKKHIEQVEHLDDDGEEGEEQ